MGYPYQPRQAVGGEGQVVTQQPFPIPAKQVTAGTPVTSSVISFNPDTTTIEITAGNAVLALKWGSASVIATAGTANYDHLIPIQTTRRFAIPFSGQGVPSIVGLNTQAGLYSTCALIVASSILGGLTEY